MIKKLTPKTFTFRRIVEEMQKQDMSKSGYPHTELQSTALLWDYCSAIRGPDIDLSEGNVEIKSLFTSPLRGFRLAYAMCLSESLEKNEELFDIVAKRFTINRFHGASKDNKAHTHYFYHIYCAWKAIRVILQNSEQGNQIKRFIYDIAVIHDYFAEDDRGLSGHGRVSAKDARDAVNSYKDLLIKFLGTIIEK